MARTQGPCRVGSGVLTRPQHRAPPPGVTPPCLHLPYFGGSHRTAKLPAGPAAPPPWLQQAPWLSPPSLQRGGAAVWRAPPSPASTESRAEASQAETWQLGAGGGGEGGEARCTPVGRGELWKMNGCGRQSGAAACRVCAWIPGSRSGNLLLSPLRIGHDCEERNGRAAGGKGGLHSS